MLSRNGVAYNLELSPYEIIIEYDHEKIKYKFSTQLNLERFKKKLNDNRDKINGSLSNRFNIKITNNQLCDIKLYSQVETRGFYIECKERKFTCLSSIKLNGQNKISKN